MINLFDGPLRSIESLWMTNAMLVVGRDSDCLFTKRKYIRKEPKRIGDVALCTELMSDLLKVIIVS